MTMSAHEQIVQDEFFEETYVARRAAEFSDEEEAVRGSRLKTWLRNTALGVGITSATFQGVVIDPEHVQASIENPVQTPAILTNGPCVVSADKPETFASCAAAQAEARIAVIPYGVPSKTAELFAKNVEVALDKTSDGVLSPELEVVHPTPSASKTFGAITLNNCVSTAAGQSLGERARWSMTDELNEFDFVMGITSLPSCKESTMGVAMPHPGRTADIYRITRPKPSNVNVYNAVHELGHLYRLGHGGVFEYATRSSLIQAAYTDNFGRVKLDVDNYLRTGRYREYAFQEPMGVHVLHAKPELKAPDTLDASEHLVLDSMTKNAPMLRGVPGEPELLVPNSEVAKDIVAVPLNRPVRLLIDKNNPKSAVFFDTLFVLPERSNYQYENGDEETFFTSFELQLGDMTGDGLTRNIVSLGFLRNSDEFVKDKKLINLRVGGTEVGVRLTYLTLDVSGKESRVTSLANSFRAED
jgi:hypothetical protein